MIKNIEEKLKNSKSKKLGIILACGYWAIANRIVAFLPGYRIRRFILRNIFRMRIGNKSSIQMKLFVLAPHRIKIGDNTNIGVNCLLDGRRNITIGSNVDINFNVKIFTLEHDIQSPDYHTKGGPVIIEDYACISSNSLILPNVKIGKGSVVAAGSVVTKDVPCFSIVAGIPARKIGERNKNLQYKLEPNPFPFH